MIWPLFRYILMAASRDRFFLSLAGILVVVISLSVFFGASVVAEQQQFARTFVSFGLRLFGVSILILFVTGFIRRSFEARDVDYLLSRPMGRVSFILTHAAAFSFLGLLAAVLLGGTVAALQIKYLHEGLFMWWLSLGVEFMIMANVAMFFAFMISSTSACVMIIFAFYLLSRLMGEIIGILQHGTDSGWSMLLGKVMEVISIFIPRLDLMGQSGWILYGMPDNISLPFILGQGVIFLSLIICATIIDMKRRQF